MRRLQVHESNKPGAACKKGLIKVMKVRGGGWKLNLLPPSEVHVYGGRSWPKIFNQRLKPFTEAEDDLIVKLHSLLGNRWALIAGRLPDRTEDEVKTHWNSKLEAKLSQNGNMHTKKRNLSMNVTRTIDQSPVSDAASGLEEDSSVTRGLNLDLSMSVSTSPLWDAKEKIEANSSDHSANVGTGRSTGNKTLLLFQ